MRLLAIMLAAGAAAGTTTISDRNDVSGRLDLRSAKAVTTPYVLGLTITTWDAWPAKALRAGGKNRLRVLYDIDNDRVADFTGRVVYSGGKLSYRISGRTSNFEPVPARRTTRKKVTFLHPVDIMLPKPTQRKMHIAVVSTYGKSGDRMPNKPGWATLIFPPPRPQ